MTMSVSSAGYFDNVGDELHGGTAVFIRVAIHQH